MATKDHRQTVAETEASVARRAGRGTGLDDDRGATGLRRRATSSQLLRAREVPGFSFGDERIDVRGWPVYARDAVLVGSVGALFVEPRTKSVRYLGVTLNDPRTGIPTGTVLVPIGSASRPHDRHVVILTALSSAQLTQAPRLPNRPVTRTDEVAALMVYGMATQRDIFANDLYAGPNFEERRLLGRPSSRS